MNALVRGVKQISQYPLNLTANPNDTLLVQSAGEVGAPFRSIRALDFASTVFATGGNLNLNLYSQITWNADGDMPGHKTALGFNSFTGAIVTNAPIETPNLIARAASVAGSAVATQAYVAEVHRDSVTSFNGRRGDIQLEVRDILKGGGAPTTNAHFNGDCTAPTIWNPNANTDSIATTGFVQKAICNFFDIAKQLGVLVSSFNGRGGAVVLTAADITSALTVDQTTFAQANTPAVGDNSQNLATTAFVVEALSGGGTFAPLFSPQFTGVPTAPTAAAGTSTGQLATTAFVHNAITSATAGVSSFNSRTGAVQLTAADITAATGALLASPAFTGIPTAPTAPLATSTTQIATCAFVEAAVAAGVAGVASFNTRTGAVVLTQADVTAVGAALTASPAFTGVPTAPTAAPATSTTQLASTAFVQAAITAAGGVSSFNSRSGAVTLQAADISAAGGAVLASPAFTGTPTAPTQSAATNNTTLATTAFVQNAVSSATAGVASFNGRTGTVVLVSADVTNVGGALLAGPTFTGVPSAPTAAPGTSTTQLATTAFVTTAVAAVTGGVTSFNSRTGTVTLQAADVSAVGGALLAGPAFTGAPTAPTPAPGTNNTTLATTAFVAAALTVVGGVTTFNGRAGAVSLTLADVTGVGGAPIASPTFTGVPSAPTATAGTSTTQLATTAFVAAAITAIGAPPTPYASNPAMNGTASPGSISQYSRGDHVHPTDTSRAPLASPIFTGTVTIPAGASISGYATTASVPAASSTTPLAPIPAGAVGTGTTYARSDHQHPGAITGVANNSSAAAGQVGETIEASVAYGTGAGLVNNVAAVATSISLTAGDWEVSGIIFFNGTGTTTISSLQSCITTGTTIALSPLSAFGDISYGQSTPFSGGGASATPCGPTRISLAATTTINLVGSAGFASSTCQFYGCMIHARRVR